MSLTTRFRCQWPAKKILLRIFFAGRPTKNNYFSFRFNSEVAVTLFLPHHSLREVEKLLGMEEGKEKDLRPAASERARKASNLPEKSSDAPEKEEGGEKKPRKLKQFTLQQQVEILDELVASGGNKYR